MLGSPPAAAIVAPGAAVIILRQPLAARCVPLHMRRRGADGLLRCLLYLLIRAQVKKIGNIAIS
jgi:hypothetical protein